jgi:predicted phosphodiesterase
MKLAVLADIHANLAALEEIAAHIDQWQPDAVLVNGDTVNRGPRPRECWEFVRQRRATSQPRWIILKGNHEEYVLAHGQPRPHLKEAEMQIFRTSEWAYQQLGPVYIDELVRLPLALEMDEAMHWQALPAANAIARCTHGSMLGIRDGIYVKTPDDTLRKQIGEHCPALFAVGHTHQPLIRPIDQTLVVNVGAVGLPFDGDWRACYAQLTWHQHKWHAEIIRQAYDRARTERDYVDTGFLQNGGPLCRLMLRELQIAHGQLHSWGQAYETQVMADELTVDQAVEAFLTK